MSTRTSLADNKDSIMLYRVVSGDVLLPELTYLIYVGRSRMYD